MYVIILHEVLNVSNKISLRIYKYMHNLGKIQEFREEFSDIDHCREVFPQKGFQIEVLRNWSSGILNPCW